MHKTSTDAFIQATCIAWQHLQPADRKAVRASCRGGRLQHDRLLTHLQLTLGATRPQEAIDAGNNNNNYYKNNNNENKITIAHGSPAAGQIRTSLQGVLARGARLGSLAVCFTDDRDGSREAQLHAALAACSCCPLSRLGLEGAVPITGSTAEAVSTCCPHVTSLTLDHERYGGALNKYVVHSHALVEYQYGCIELLTHCGPRLTHLRLWVMDRWPALLYKYVARCTALTSLELTQRRGYSYGSTHIAESLAIESTVYTSVAQLTGLRSLHLRLDAHGATCSPEDLHPHTAYQARLSSLTALTHLHLELHSCYQPNHDSWSRHHEREVYHQADWRELRDAHRTTLLSVLGRMQQLQCLHCPTLWLTPSEAATLTALTGLHLGGLLLPGGNGGPSSLPASSSWALPPLLRELHLHDAASPRLLAGLQLPCSLLRVSVTSICFGMSDVTEEGGRIKEQAVQAVGPAVRRLVRYRGGGEGGSISIVGDGSSGRMQPREGSPDGHVEWVRQLQGLDAVVGHLTLDNMALSAEDLGCLGKALPHLKGLHLRKCIFPVASVPVMRHYMTRLTHLELDLYNCDSMNQQELASVLLQLCRPHPGAEQLQRLECQGLFHWMPSDESRACKWSVEQQLARKYGVRGVEVRM